MRVRLLPSVERFRFRVHAHFPAILMPRIRVVAQACSLCGFDRGEMHRLKSLCYCGGNSAVESRPSKPMVAGSNPVPRSSD